MTVVRSILVLQTAISVHSLAVAAIVVSMLHCAPVSADDEQIFSMITTMATTLVSVRCAK